METKQASFDELDYTIVWHLVRWQHSTVSLQFTSIIIKQETTSKKINLATRDIEQQLRYGPGCSKTRKSKHMASY